MLFLYLNREGENEVLYTFFEEDIIKWTINKNEYRLNLSENAIVKFNENIFTNDTVLKLNKLLKVQELKMNTTIINDGIFLEKAIALTKNLYADIWPDKIFKNLSLENVVENLLIYNQFMSATEAVNCIVFLGSHHSLESVIDLSIKKDYNQYNSKIRFLIYMSADIISFQVLEQLKRVVNAENVLLVADDVIYQSELDDLAEKGVEIIMVKQNTNSGSRLFTSFKWGDIAYPIGRSLGLKGHEL